MAQLDVPNAYLEIAPLVVTSPTTRCGTTLVQRLLSASDNAFVYGEEIGKQLKTLTGPFLTAIRYCQANEVSLNDGFARALAGTLDEWRPGLAPPAEVMLQAWVQTYYQWPATLQAFGASIGRPIWGFKWPGFPPADARALLSFLPKTRIVYVLRHPAEALKSAKARRFVKTTEDAAAFCADWTRYLTASLALRDDPRVLWLRYEDLLADKTAQLAALEAFTGARNIRPAEFDVKVNTFAGSAADGHSPSQYIAPAALTEEELAVVRAEAGALIAEFYPERC